MLKTENGKRQRDEKLRLLLLDKADDFPDYDNIHFDIYVKKSRKDVKIHPTLIDTGKKSS